jgi:hypothetical protein
MIGGPLSKATACLVAVLAVWVLWLRAEGAGLRAERDELRRAVSVAEAERALATEARDVAKAHYERVQRDAKAWRGLEVELHNMEGRDAPLSDHLRAASGRLWP